MRGHRAMGKIQRNNYHHWSCGPSLTGETMSVFLIFAQGTHRNVKNRRVRSSLQINENVAPRGKFRLVKNDLSVEKFISY